MFTIIDKAIASFVMPLLLQGIFQELAPLHIAPDTTIGTAISMLLTGLVTYLVPNKPAAPGVKK